MNFLFFNGPTITLNPREEARRYARLSPRASAPRPPRAAKKAVIASLTSSESAAPRMTVLELHALEQSSVASRRK